MTKPFLRSGSLDKLVALGENGQPIYAQAQSVREALRLKHQPAIADCLAIPQLNAQQDRIDWYAPFSGEIRPWAVADDNERRAALAQLDACLTEVEALSRQAIAAPQAALQRFGALLRYLLRFPDMQHVYLVDGKPVLTFWGFSHAGQNGGDDPFAFLRAGEPPPAPAVATALSTPSEAPDLPPPPRAGRPRWLLPVIVVLMTLAALGWQWRQSHDAAPQAAAPEPVLPMPPAAPPAIKPIPPLPLAKATLQPAPPAPEPAAPPSDNRALIMPAAAVKAGSTRFLNGEWRAVPEVKTPLTGRLPSLLYRLHSGKGSVSLRQADNVRCQVDVETGLMPSGKLVINSRTKARCSDGSRYQIPEIVCQPQEDRPAACSGRYGPDTLYPMTLKREKK
ncbi:SrfA family protein [Serratia rhizosphaerae]|uniref:Virulence effector protein n=1 Tax=Serratia rhizosphaerae TaxID=2597702 RepID=A0ABX6GT79_9GAMM|nr:SrfA family protein [Serratia rhizosphaerae]QHA89492.1 hypothetical protein FO014_22290 [Serratia rhizosphaerae]